MEAEKRDPGNEVVPPPGLSGSIPRGQCHTVGVNFCSMRFCQPLHIHKLKDEMIDDKNNG